MKKNKNKKGSTLFGSPFQVTFNPVEGTKIIFTLPIEVKLDNMKTIITN